MINPEKDFLIALENLDVSIFSQLMFEGFSTKGSSLIWYLLCNFQEFGIFLQQQHHPNHLYQNVSNFAYFSNTLFLSARSSKTTIPSNESNSSWAFPWSFLVCFLYFTFNFSILTFNFSMDFFKLLNLTGSYSNLAFIILSLSFKTPSFLNENNDP